MPSHWKICKFHFGLSNCTHSGFFLYSLSRYLHRNVEQTHGRRGEVKRLKDQLTVLQQKLERSGINDPICQRYKSRYIYIYIFWKCYTVSDFALIVFSSFSSYKNYGSGPNKYPLADMLQYILEFATSKQTNTSTSPTSAGPASTPAHTEPSSEHAR